MQVKADQIVLLLRLNEAGWTLACHLLAASSGRILTLPLGRARVGSDQDNLLWLHGFFNVFMTGISI